MLDSEFPHGNSKLLQCLSLSYSVVLTHSGFISNSFVHLSRGRNSCVSSFKGWAGLAQTSSTTSIFSRTIFTRFRNSLLDSGKLCWLIRLYHRKLLWVLWISECRSSEKETRAAIFRNVLIRYLLRGENLNAISDTCEEQQQLYFCILCLRFIQCEAGKASENLTFILKQSLILSNVCVIVKFIWYIISNCLSYSTTAKITLTSILSVFIIGTRPIGDSNRPRLDKTQ